MRVNVYTEELIPLSNFNFDKDPPPVEIIKATYTSSRTGEEMTNYGLRIYLKSATDLHFVRNADGLIRDDDRSAVTFWLGPKEKDIFTWLANVRDIAYAGTLKTWHDKTEAQQKAAEKALPFRSLGEPAFYNE